MENLSRYPFHLCQPDNEKSCGACCGLYNWHDHSRKTLNSLLQRRTSSFFSLGKEIDFHHCRQWTEVPASNPKLLEAIYNCEFLGFIDRGQKRVGCLLHPSIHQGVDLRWNSFYGVELCAGHFCPSYTHLTKVEQSAVFMALDDWYLYGLVITDIDLVKEFFKHVQNRLGESIRVECLENIKVRTALRDFFRFKEFWKFSSAKNRLGKYYFSYSEYHIARIEYEKRWQIKPSHFDKILVSLSSEFTTQTDVGEAESLIEEAIERFVEAYFSS